MNDSDNTSNHIASNFSSTNLTAGQLRIWTGQKLDPDLPLYNMALAFYIQGKINPLSFREAFNVLVNQSDALRSVFIERQGVPQQHVLDQLNYNLELIDFTNKPASRDTLQRWLKDRTARQFNIEKCLFDSALIKLFDHNFVWFLNQHHLITDGWACAVIYKRMAEFYQLAQHDRLNEVPELPRFSDYQAYEHNFRKSKAWINANAYWKNKALNPAVPFDLYGHTPSDKGTRTERVLCDLGLERSESLRSLAQERDFRAFSLHLSLFNIFSALLFAYLYKVSGNTSLVIGSPVHNRPTDTFKETIGLFIELFPLRIQISQDTTFRGLVKTVEPESINFLRNALPGASDSKSQPAYSVVLNYINVAFADFCDFPMKSSWIHPDHGDRGHALRLQVQDFDSSGRIQLHFDFSREMFNRKLRKQAVSHFITLVDALLKNPDQPIQRINMASHDEKARLIYQNNETIAERPTNITVVDLFNQQATKTPNAVAVIELGRHISYRDLNLQSDQLAAYLQREGVGRDSLVGIFLERSTELIVAIIGVLKVGAAFVPIDASFPKKRIAHLIDDCRPEVVLTQESLHDHILGCNADLICLDSEKDKVTEKINNLEGSKTDQSGMAYVIYTSGSTGNPKGVVIEHGALLNYLLWAKKKYMHDGPYNMPLFSTIAADLTITSIFLPLISGGKVVVYREPKSGVDLSVFDAFEDSTVDIIKLTPSHLSMLADKNRPSKRLKKLIVGGEDFKTALARKVNGLFNGNIEIYNEYGPTEATVGCMIYRFDPNLDQSQSVAIGVPIENTQIYLLDQGLNPVPVGIKGDIYIAGNGLARGYLNQPELTSQLFIANPFQPGKRMYRSGDVGRWNSKGMLEFLGRKDHQVKVRGFRIELGEIEANLLNHPDIRETFAQVIDHQSVVKDIAIRYCIKCGLASNHPQSKLDEKGICQICLNFEKQKDIAQKYFKKEKDLFRILAHAREVSTGKYDCLMQYSGGKDSTYALYKLVEMGALPLVFSFDNGYISEDAKENIHRVVDDLKLDLVWGHTDAMKEIFVDSLRRFSNVCNGCQKVINTLSVNLALEKGVQYIITGLSRGQFFETRVSELFSNKIYNSEDIDRFIVEGRKAYHRMDDAVSKNLNVAAFQDDSIFQKIQFVDFYRYCNVELYQILEFLAEKAPWIRPVDTGRSTNCMINEAGIYIHKKERGFHNYALPYSWDVRLGHKDRASALEELNDNIDENRVDKILKDIGYDPEEKAFSLADRRIVAYYVADQEFPPEKLRSFLSSTLPAYTIPAHFIQIDSFPLNPTGKIDRDALPLPDNLRTGLLNEYVSPRNSIENLLCDIWERVLGIEKVGINDNFFDLGGDSILSIQIIAHAQSSGLIFTPSLLFQFPTIAELATRVESSHMINADQKIVTGPVPMTPIQRWFFSLNIPNRQYWSMMLRLKASREIGPATLEQALEQLLRHHDAFRLRFSTDSSVWEQTIEAPDESITVDFYNLSNLTVSEQSEAVKEHMSRIQSSLDLKSGTLIRLVQFDLGKDLPFHIIILIHHLAVDGLSWNFLLEDLDTICRSIIEKRTLTLPRKTSSFKLWSEKMVKYANEPRAETEISYWEKQGRKNASLPRDIDKPGNARELTTHTIVAKLDESNSRALLQEVVHLNKVAVDELILAALLPVLCDWSNSRYLRFDREGHGREDIFENVSVSRTSGWFTSLYPLVFKYPTSREPDKVVVAVKDMIRNIPNGGIGYGALRYLNEKENTNKTLKSQPNSELLFNYLGNQDRLIQRSSLFQLNGALEIVRDPKSQRPYLLEINAFIHRSCLEVHWSYSMERHQKQTIQRLSKEFIDALKTLVNWYLTGVTDKKDEDQFPLAKLSAGQMKKISRLLDESE